MSVQAINTPEKFSFIRVGFFSRTTGVFLKGYSNVDFTDTEDSNEYTSVPGLAVDFAPNSGAIDSGGELETKFTIPIMPGDTWLPDATDGLAFEPIKVRIREFVRGIKPGELGSILHWVHGDVILYTGDKPTQGVVELTARPDKGDYNQPSGLLCTGQCRNVIFTAPCSRVGVYGPQIAIERRLATVSSASYQQLTVAGYIPIDSPKTFVRGYVEVEGARITVADWDSGTPGLFKMVEAVPQRWVGKTATLVPGCNRTIEACRLQWNNEDRANTIGIKMPGTSPLFDSNR